MTLMSSQTSARNRSQPLAALGLLLVLLQELAEKVSQHRAAFDEVFFGCWGL